MDQGPFPLIQEMSTLVKNFLVKKGYPFTETGLLQAIKENKSKTNVYMAVIGLREVGTQKSVEWLKGLVNYPMDDVKSTCLLTIAHLVGVSETPFYSAMLADSKYKQKTYAMWVISQVGDKSALKAVMEYAQKIIKKRVTKYSLDQVISYLEKNSWESKVEETLLKLKEIKK
jgi:hypothetical protein